MNKNRIIEKLFNSKWNYSGFDTDNHVISLFYKKGGFTGLYDYVLSEKSRMKNFEICYSSDLLETLSSSIIQFEDSDFREYIFNSTMDFNKNNFLILETYGLLKYFGDFSGSFRGNIKNIYKIEGLNIRIIETLGGIGSTFYNDSEFSICFNSLETAIIYKIYNGKHFDTLSSLLDNVNDEKDTKYYTSEEISKKYAVLSLKEKNKVLYEAIDYMQSYSGRSRFLCIAMAMGYGNCEGDSKSYFKR